MCCKSCNRPRVLGKGYHLVVTCFQINFAIFYSSIHVVHKLFHCWNWVPFSLSCFIGLFIITTHSNFLWISELGRVRTSPLTHSPIYIHRQQAQLCPFQYIPRSIRQVAFASKKVLFCMFELPV